MRWLPRKAVATEDGRRTLRRSLLASLLAVTGAVAAALWGWRPRVADGGGYREVARWRIPGGEGRFVAVGLNPSLDELRALGERLREELRDRDNAVVMVFDDPEAARQVRRGSRYIGEERFQAALAHQRAVYIKQAGRGEHSLSIYERYPTVVREVVRY